MELELKKREQLYKMVIDNMPGPMVLFDKNLTTLYFNKSCQELVGLSLKEGVGKTPADLFPPELTATFVPYYQKAIQEKTVVKERIEVNFTGKDVVLALQVLPVFDNEGEVEFVFGVSEDWTELEDQRSEAMASASLASLGYMAANITHEINNPLQLIQLRLCRLEEMIESDPTNTEAMLSEIKDIHRTSNRINKIIESVRRQARANLDQGLKATYATELIEEAITYSRNLIDNARAELILDIKKGSRILCNPIEVEQVLINLISNSCDAIKGQENPWIKISSSVQKDQAIILIEDSGPRISTDVEKNLMKPFFSTKKNNKSSGLGLNLSRTLIRRNQGQLNYLPHKENTAFEIRLTKS